MQEAWPIFAGEEGVGRVCRAQLCYLGDKFQSEWCHFLVGRVGWLPVVTRIDFSFLCHLNWVRLGFMAVSYSVVVKQEAVSDRHLPIPSVHVNHNMPWAFSVTLQLSLLFLSLPMCITTSLPFCRPSLKTPFPRTSFFLLVTHHRHSLVSI